MDDASSPLLLHALERLLRDRDSGALLDLTEYQALFPEFETELAEHYVLLSEPVATGDEGALGHVGRYRLLEEIGRGGQGVVYRALDEALGRTVALKLLTGLGALDENALRRFLREAQATSRLQHPGICPIFEHGQDAGMPFIAMAYVEGQSLADRLRTETAGGQPPSRIQIDQLLELFERAARALHAAHEAGVVHRDVKPANLMIRSDGQPVLLDFGVARIVEDDGATLTRSGHVLGTPAYMSPEQLGGRAGPVDQRTDVYSLGVSLFEALTLERPFSAPTRESLYRQILTEAAPDVRALNPHLPRDVGAIVETALQKAPDERYGTAADLADDLASARHGKPIHARPPGPLRRLGKWAGRNPGWVASLGVIIVLLIVGTTIVSWLAVRAERSRADAELLADAARLDTLFEQASWPADPENIRAYEAWFRAIDTIIAREGVYSASLEAVRAHARPQSEADRAADRERYALHYANLEDIPRQRSQIAGQPEALAKLAEYERRVREVIARRFTYTFADPDQQLRHDVLRKLVRELFNVNAPAGEYHVTLEDMRKRLDLARHLGERIQGEDAEPWARCVNDVARSGSGYNGLVLEPTPGLVPLGKDRWSGLWEFWHVPSGARPDWDGEPGGVGSVSLHPTAGEEGIVLVLIPGGSFDMGARRPTAMELSSGRTTEPNVDPDADERVEFPVHAVRLDPFLLSKYETTRGQWLRLMYVDPAAVPRKTRDREPGTLRHPAIEVTWDECLEACRRWSLMLPTEAQWEYACRAGTTSPYWTGREPGSLEGCANTADSTSLGVHDIELKAPIVDDFRYDAPVGALAPNPWGLHDVHGNVEEWCRDGRMLYGESEHAPGDGMTSPLVGMSGRTARSGSWGLPAVYSRSSARQQHPPDYASSDTGFRASCPAPIRTE